MAIITIARQMGSQGTEIAANVAQRLSYTLVDQAKLQEAAETYGMLKSELEEVHEKRPTLVTRYLTMRHRAYLDMIQTIIYQHARADDVVILARGATVLLSDVPSALHVNTFAPFERRVDVVMTREGISRLLARANRAGERPGPSWLYAIPLRPRLDESTTLRPHDQHHCHYP